MSLFRRKSLPVRLVAPHGHHVIEINVQLGPLPPLRISATIRQESK